MKKRKIATVLTAAMLIAGTANASDISPTYTSDMSGVVTNKYVVDFDDDVDRDEIDAILTGRSYTDAPLWEEMKMEIVTSEQDMTGFSHEDIEGVEPLTVMTAYGFEPNDPLYSSQWHMKKVDVEGSWNYSAGRGVTVAVIDTGVACDNYSHFHKVSDLKQTICVPGYNAFDKSEHANDDHGHGTHVAGTIAQSTNNNVGGVGMAFGAKIMPVKVLSGNGSGSNATVAAGIHWAADNGAQVLNLSLGGPAKSGVIQRAVDFARSKGALVIAAAGNDGGAVGYPAACDGVIAVSATDEDDSLAWFSNRGPEIDIAAPGVNVTQNTICEGGRNNCEIFPAWNGTSMATPHVAGAAALIIGAGVTDDDMVQSYLLGTAEEKGSPTEYGSGIVQPAEAVSNINMKHAGMRGLILLVLAWFTSRLARSRGDSWGLRSPGFWIAATVTGVGMFFIPMFFGRHTLIADVLSRPVGEWTLLFDVNIHKYLPFANALAPLVPAALFMKLHDGAGKWLSGIYVGTGAFLGATIMTGSMGLGLMGTAWCVINAALCVYIGSLLLVKSTARGHA